MRPGYQLVDVRNAQAPDDVLDVNVVNADPISVNVSNQVEVVNPMSGEVPAPLYVELLTQPIEVNHPEDVNVRVKPIYNGGRGHYRIVVSTGYVTAGLAGGSEILQFRWTSATYLAVIRSIRLVAAYATTAFASSDFILAAKVARSYTASGSGGSATSLTGNAQKLATSMQTSVVGDLRISSTGALTPGTATLDTNTLGAIWTHTGASPAVGNIPMIDTTIFDARKTSDHGLLLAQNEGFVVQAWVPGTGVWRAAFEIDWAEVQSYP